MGFEDLFINLQNWGFLDVVLPFLLVFTIVFAILQKTKILGDGRKNYNVIVALVMGASIIFPHLTGSYIAWIGFDPVDVINASLPQVSIILVAVIMVLLLIGVWGNELEFANTSLSGWIVIISFVIVFLIFGHNTGWFVLPSFLWFVLDPDIASLLVMILVFGVIIWFVTKDEGKKEEKSMMERYFGAPLKPKK